MRHDLRLSMDQNLYDIVSLEHMRRTGKPCILDILEGNCDLVVPLLAVSISAIKNTTSSEIATVEFSDMSGCSILGYFAPSAVRVHGDRVLNVGAALLLKDVSLS